MYILFDKTNLCIFKHLNIELWYIVIFIKNSLNIINQALIYCQNAYLYIGNIITFEWNTNW
jgi:hypothetical protein